MTPAQRHAVDITKEIVVSKMSSCNLNVGKDGGQNVADFFEEIYKKVYEITSKEENA